MIGRPSGRARPLAVLALLAWAFGLALPAAAAENWELYFVAVGISRYANPIDAETRGLDTIYGVSKNTRALAARLLAGGAKYGALLTSTENGLVTPQDIDDAVSRVAVRIRADGARKPLLFVYLASHGVSEGVGWTQFSLPGDFLYRGKLADQPVEGLARYAVPAAALADRLDKIGARYVLVLDTCYGADEANFDSPILTAAAIGSLKSVAGVLRFMNEFHQSSPVIFSAEPGTLAKTVVDPVYSYPEPMPPLAHRMMIMFDEAARADGALDLRSFIDGMTSSGLDSLTSPAITNAEPSADWKGVFLSFSNQTGAIDERSGSGTEGVVCCPIPTDVGTNSDTSGVASAASAFVEFSGGSDEYISGGSLVRHDGSVRFSQDGSGTVTVSFEEHSDDWELSFSAPDGKRLARGKYESAVRYPFAESQQPSLAITGAGRACNDVLGTFTVEGVVYDNAGRITSFDAAFEQYCDGSPSPLRGKLRLSR